ncbi:MAG: YcxB family protein [Eubacterium sp.]
MEVKFELKLSTKDMFKFFIYHNYARISGCIALIVSVLCLFMAAYSFGKTDPVYTLVYLFAGLLFTVIQPVMLYKKADKQVKDSDFINKPLTYVINDDGVTISQDNQSDFVKWSDMFKVRETNSLAILYATPNRAFVLPKGVIGQQYKEFRTIVNNNVKALSYGRALR